MEFVGKTIKWNRSAPLSGISLSLVTLGEFFNGVNWIPCAVKRIEKSLRQEESLKQYREIKALKEQIDNVIEYFGVEETNDHWYIACEKFDLDLKIYITDDNLPRTRHQRLNVAKQAALGLCSIHNNGWVHKDIKPSNFLIRLPTTSEDGEDIVCKVADLGFAKPVLHDRDHADWSPRIGTHLYIAPELSESTAETCYPNNYDRCFKKEHDVWAMGCVLHFIFTEFHPFSPEIDPLAKHSVTLTNINSGSAVSLKPVEWIHGGEIGFETLVRSMIDRDPSKRPNMNDVKEEIISWHL